MPHRRNELLEEEWFIVRHSGEIPEIALHSALYYLTEDLNGPQLQLSVSEIQHLQEAAVTRYQEIILRDLCYENRELTIYRGVQRAIYNWHRFIAFCERQNTACHNLRRRGMKECSSFQERIQSDRRITAEALLVLLNKVMQSTDNVPPSPDHFPAILDTLDTKPPLARVFNCTFHDLALFAHELEISEEQLPKDIHLFCHK